MRWPIHSTVGRSIAGLRRLLVIAGLVVVWITFGANYIAIKVGVSAIPPFFFSGVRFVLAGALLMGWCAVRAGGLPPLRRSDLVAGATSGAALILVGQGSVSWASTELAPGLVAVLIATVPLWAAALGRALHGTRISALAAIGLIAGFAGVCLLAFPFRAGLPLPPVLVLTGGAVAWAVGTLIVAGSEMRRRVVLLTSLQFLTGGVLQLATGVALGEAGQVHPAAITPLVVAAFGFGLVFTSLIGFTTFVWLIEAASLAVANSQAYVVPVVSLLLGWLLLAEPLTPRVILASGVSLAGVAILVVGQSRSRAEAAS
jgi:drug/metabolite transporter (DMT)-like permease